METVDYLVIGAGPTGLGAATRLHQQLGPAGRWRLVDSEPRAGGLACTDVTPEGFLFDMGGHVIFSHFDYFDGLIDQAVGVGDEHWATHERVSYVWIKDRWVPYPFQNNLYCLPLEDKITCLKGAIEAAAQAGTAPAPKTFDEWILRVMGEGIADLFMRPYNFKVWAYPTTEMQCDWLGERVATVDAKRLVENVLRDRPELGWGPNATFRFPREGGTGSIWQKVSELLPKEKCSYGKTVAGIDAEAKVVSFSDGSAVQYQKLMSTLPLDIVMGWTGVEGAERLQYSSTHVVGVGLRGLNPHHLKCWLYYPEDDTPFYRCTVFSHYAEKNVPAQDVKLPTLRTASDPNAAEPEPREGPYWSLMFEISESRHRPVDSATLVAETIRGALSARLVQSTDEVVSTFHRRLERGYPTPHVDRDGVLATALPALKQKDIWQRGRFGSWKYEVGNQDHSCMLGVEAADNMVHGTTEFVLEFPGKANGKKNTDLKYTYVPP